MQGFGKGRFSSYRQHSRGYGLRLGNRDRAYAFLNRAQNTQSSQAQGKIQAQGQAPAQGPAPTPTPAPAQVESQAQSPSVSNESEDSLSLMDDSFLTKSTYSVSTSDSVESESESVPVCGKEIESEYNDIVLHEARYFGYNNGISPKGFTSYMIDTNHNDNNGNGFELENEKYVEFDKRKQEYFGMKQISESWKCDKWNGKAKMLVNQVQVLSATQKQLNNITKKTKDFRDEIINTRMSKNEVYYYFFEIARKVWHKPLSIKIEKGLYIYALFIIEAFHIFNQIECNDLSYLRDFAFIFINMGLFEENILWMIPFIDYRGIDNDKIGTITQQHSELRCILLKHPKMKSKEKYELEEKNKDEDDTKYFDYQCFDKSKENFACHDTGIFHDCLLKKMVLFYMIIDNGDKYEDCYWGIKNGFAMKWLNELMSLPSFAIPEIMAICYFFLLYCGNDLKQTYGKSFDVIIEKIYKRIVLNYGGDSNDSKRYMNHRNCKAIIEEYMTGNCGESGMYQQRRYQLR